MNQKINTEQLTGTIECEWSNGEHEGPGWYLRHLDATGQITRNAAKIWLAIDFDSFARENAKELQEAIERAFPNCVVVIVDD